MKTTSRSVRSALLPAVLVAALVGSLSAQPAPYERVLFPIVTDIYPVAGANGSLWVSEERVLNRSGADVALYGTYYCFMCGTKYGPTHFSPEVAYFHLPVRGEYGIPGSFLFIDRSAVNEVTFSSRIRDISRTDRSFGTQLPVIREAQFSAERTDLLGVPTDSRFRRTLRVYGSTEAGGTILVRVFSEVQNEYVGPLPADPNPLLAEQTATMIDPPANAPDRANYPAFAPIGEIPNIGSAPTNSVRVEIVPVTPGLRIWAFVSVTNNETQEVTIVSPQ
jgi:hypothetical protein